MGRVVFELGVGGKVYRGAVEADSQPVSKSAFESADEKAARVRRLLEAKRI